MRLWTTSPTRAIKKSSGRSANTHAAAEVDCVDEHLSGPQLRDLRCRKGPTLGRLDFLAPLGAGEVADVRELLRGSPQPSQRPARLTGTASTSPLRCWGEKYLGVRMPVRAQVIRRWSASALGATWATTWRRLQPSSQVRASSSFG